VAEAETRARAEWTSDLARDERKNAGPKKGKFGHRSFREFSKSSTRRSPEFSEIAEINFANSDIRNSRETPQSHTRL